MSWPRASVQSTWSRMDLPAGVFANKLNSGAVHAPPTSTPRYLNDPSALNHLGTSALVEVPIDVFGKVGHDGRRDGRLRGRGLGGPARRDPGDPDARRRGLPAGRDGGPRGRGHREGARRREGARGRDRGARRRRAAPCRPTCCARGPGGASARPTWPSGAASSGWRRPASPGCSARPTASTYVPTEAPPGGRPAGRGRGRVGGARALRQRPVLEAARRKQDAAAAFLKNEKNGLLPDIGAFGQVWDNRIDWDNGSQAWAVGLGVQAGRRSTPAAASARRRRTRGAARGRAGRARRGRPGAPRGGAGLPARGHGARAARRRHAAGSRRGARRCASSRSAARRAWRR